MKYNSTRDRIAACLIVLILFLFATIGVFRTKFFGYYWIDAQENDYYCNADNIAAGYHKSKDCESFLYKMSVDPVALFTGGLFIFTIALAVAAVNLVRVTRKGIAEQAELTRESLRHAEASVRAAEKAIESSNNASRQQLRAYVTIESGIISLYRTPNGVAFYTVNIKLRNTGATPAMQFRTYIDGNIFGFNDIPFTDVAEDKKTQRSILGPTTFFEINTQGTKIAEVDLDEIRKRDKAIFVWGGVEYVDIFKESRFYKFKIRVSGPDGEFMNGRIRGWALNPHPMGYEAN